MSREYWGIAILAFVSILLLTILGRPDKPRESLFLFVLEQTMTWPLTIFLVFMDKIQSPVRLFPKATDSNFILAFVFIPAVFVAYYWHYPRNKNRIIQIAYTLTVTGGTMLVHVAVQSYTGLLEYIAVSGYTMWPVVIIGHYVKRIYADWYFRQLTKAKAGNSR